MQPDNLPVAAHGCSQLWTPRTCAHPPWMLQDPPGHTKRDRALYIGSGDHHSHTPPRLLCYEVPCCVLARLSSALPLNTFKVQQMFIWGNFQEKTAQNSAWLRSNVSIAEHPRQPSSPFQCVFAQLPLNSKSYDVKKKALISVQISVIVHSTQNILTV